MLTVHNPMPRTFAYVRVSTIVQEPENQIREIEAAGFKVEPHRIVRETVSGSVAQFERDLLIERTQAGLARAKADGKTLGRPPASDQT